MLYALQKLIREINRDPDLRAKFFSTPEHVMSQYDLSEEEKSALLTRDYAGLYRLGVHGLLLRPFSLLHSVSEQDYLNAIREVSKQKVH
jgi:hypothetical protein